MGIGERIKELRGEERQSEFGERFGRNGRTINRYETEKNHPDSTFLTTLCCEYKINANWLLLGEGPKSVAEAKQPKQSTSPQTKDFYDLIWQKYIDLHNALTGALASLRVIEVNLEEEASVYLDAIDNPELIDNTRLLGLSHLTKCLADQIDYLIKAQQTRVTIS